MAGTNNFLVFNEANNPNNTMSDADYLADLYRLNGLIPMIADPIAHNKMYRQWSIMISAMAGLIASMNYNASDSDLATLQANLKSAIEDVAEAKVDPRIITLENWKSSITATPAEINILDGVTASTSELNILDGLTASTSELNTLDGITASTAELNILDGAEISTTELNYLSGAKSNIQTQINNLSISALFPLWQANTAYSVGAVVKTLSSSFWVYLECVVAGTTGATTPSYSKVGQLVTDNTVKWLVLDMRDSAPVGTIKQDIIKRDGWLKLNGAIINVADYPRLVNFLTANSLIQSYISFVGSTKFKYGDINNETLILPDFTGLFIENEFSALTAISAGLPNITGVLGYIHSNALNEGEGDWGVFKYKHYGNEITQLISPPTGKKGGYDIEFNASKGNSIYGNSSTVQPPAVTLIPVIKY